MRRLIVLEVSSDLASERFVVPPEPDVHERPELARGRREIVAGVGKLLGTYRFAQELAGETRPVPDDGVLPPPFLERADSQLVGLDSPMDQNDDH